MTSEERAAYAKAASEGDTDTAAVIVGEAIGMVRAVEPAAQIASRIAGDARRLLSSAPERSWSDTGVIR
jgi:nitronate monooxygenase